MPTYANTGLANTNSPWYGSAKLEISTDNGANWINVGLARGVTFTENIGTTDIQADNGPDIDTYVSDHEVEITFNGLEFYLPNLNRIRGGLDTLSVTTGGVATTATTAYSTGAVSADVAYFLGNQGSSSTLASVSKVVQTDTGGSATTLTVDDDYTVGRRASDNHIYVQFLNAAGSSFKSTESAVITYVYGTIPSYKLTSGGKTDISSRWWRLTNVKVISGTSKYRYITLYNVSLLNGLNMALKSSNEADPLLEMPITVKARVDATRTVGDQLFAIEDQQATG